MRIVGGKYKGRIFTPKKNFGARPTTDLAKEALFNILVNRIDFEELSVLDLFAGSGSIGYEFISRGAKNVTFVEKNYSHVQFIKKVTSGLGIENAQIIRDDTFRFLKKYPGKFDIVFADPPYDLKQLGEIPSAVFESGVLKENGLLILEHSKDYNFSGHPNFTELRNYGKLNFSFFTVPSNS
ncbi:MAG: 16S rRNA (guanine(966)-N(2))-methyltransferase RsmD [Tangfeifania sp.]